MSAIFTDLNEDVSVHATLHFEVIRYAQKPDQSEKADLIGATDTCRLGRWLSADGAAQRAPAAHAALKEAHERFHKAAADTVAQADAGTLPDGALSEQGESKAALAQLCVAIAKMLFKIG